MARAQKVGDVIQVSLGVLEYVERGGVQSQRRSEASEFDDT